MVAPPFHAATGKPLVNSRATFGATSSDHNCLPYEYLLVPMISHGTFSPTSSLVLIRPWTHSSVHPMCHWQCQLKGCTPSSPTWCSSILPKLAGRTTEVPQQLAEISVFFQDPLPPKNRNKCLGIGSWDNMISKHCTVIKVTLPFWSWAISMASSLCTRLSLSLELTLSKGSSYFFLKWKCNTWANQMAATKSLAKFEFNMGFHWYDLTP